MPSLLRTLRAAVALAIALACADAFAITVRVGPDGQYATIQAGIDAVVAAGGGDVLVESSYYAENPVIDIDNIAVGVHGGYNANFDADGLPTLVALGDGNGDSWRVVTTGAYGHAFVGGFSAIYGAIGHPGVHLEAHDASHIAFEYNTVSGNHHDATTQEDVYGGGIEAQAHDTAWVELADVEAKGNSTSAGHHAYGGGVSLHSFDASRITAARLNVHDNALTYAGDTCEGGGVFAQAGEHGTSDISLTDVTVSNNSGSCGWQAPSTGYGMMLTTRNVAAPHGIHLNRSRIIGNTLAYHGEYAVKLEGDGGSIDFSNALVAGNADGIDADGYASGQPIFVENVTSAGNTLGSGILLNGAGVQATNVLSAQNGQADFAGNGAQLHASLLDVADARFVDASASDYQLRADSPAIDTGTNVTPHGLQSLDLDGHPRPYAGGISDVGCYESSYSNDRIFADGFDG